MALVQLFAFRNNQNLQNILPGLKIVYALYVYVERRMTFIPNQLNCEKESVDEIAQTEKRNTTGLLRPTLSHFRIGAAIIKWFKFVDCVYVKLLLVVFFFLCNMT